MASNNIQSVTIYDNLQYTVICIIRKSKIYDQRQHTVSQNMQSATISEQWQYMDNENIRSVTTCRLLEEFEDDKGVIRICISKNRQNNGQKKKYKRANNDLQRQFTTYRQFEYKGSIRTATIYGQYTDRQYMVSSNVRSVIYL